MDQSRFFYFISHCAVFFILKSYIDFVPLFKKTFNLSKCMGMDWNAAGWNSRYIHTDSKLLNSTQAPHWKNMGKSKGEKRICQDPWNGTRAKERKPWIMYTVEVYIYIYKRQAAVYIHSTQRNMSKTPPELNIFFFFPYILFCAFPFSQSSYIHNTVHTHRERERASYSLCVWHRRNFRKQINQILDFFFFIWKSRPFFSTLDLWGI